MRRIHCTRPAVGVFGVWVFPGGLLSRAPSAAITGESTLSWLEGGLAVIQSWKAAPTSLRTLPPRPATTTGTLPRCSHDGQPFLDTRACHCCQCHQVSESPVFKHSHTP